MKKFLAFIAAGAMAVCLSSCGSGSSGSGNGGGYISSAVTNMGEFDFAQTCREVRLFGNDIDLPCTVGELGADFSLANGEQFEIGTTFDLMRNGKNVGSVRLSCSPSDETSNVKIDYIEFSKFCELELNGISFKSTIDDVKKRFGEPTTSDFSSLTYSSGDKYVEFYHAGGRNQQIQSIRMSF